jgi:ATP adenylyltransferase
LGIELDCGYTSAVASLWSKVLATTETASRNGSLVSVPTEQTVVNDKGIPFVVHVTTLQESKARARSARHERPFNPFLPPDPELSVGPLPPEHLAVLNKFNVLRHHLLIVTREYESQDALLNEKDFTALGECMSDIDGLGFYNGGTVAGASQSHKHLQLVPLPLGHGPSPTPLDAVFPETADRGVVTTIPELSFDHAAVPLPGSSIDSSRAGELNMIYGQACGAVGIRSGDQPYNMLLTRRWMLVVPRTVEFWHEVSINALGFAGSLLVRNRDELASLRATGPLNVLKSVVEGPP